MNTERPDLGRPTQPPLELLNEIRERLWLFTTFLFDVDGQQPRYSGTGTCVTANGAFYILTAAHVWAVLRGPRFAVSVDADRLLIPMEHEIVNLTVLSGNGDLEWGPDLALVQIPELVAIEMQARKVFYNLTRARPDRLPPTGCEEATLWAVAGAPAEQAAFTGKEAFMQLSLFDTWTVRSRDREGFDYQELLFNRERRPDLPESYRGLSGSGLWRIPMWFCHETAEIGWPKNAHLSGVAFYEVSDPPDSMIRCHGERSLREQLLRGVV